MAVSINVCNLALGRLRAKRIADIDEATLEASECKIAYPHCLGLLLELHDWSFASRIAPLAAYSTNARSSEWSYAYGLPSDVASPKRLAPSFGLPFTPGYFYPWPYSWPRPSTWTTSYVVEDGVLYTQVADAILEYSANTLDEARMTWAFKDALAYSLASEMAVPIRDDRTLKGDLFKQAELAGQRAMADDANRQPQTDAAYGDEVAFARGG
jgi:hypothetical protein